MKKIWHGFWMIICAVAIGISLKIATCLLFFCIFENKFFPNLIVGSLFLIVALIIYSGAPTIEKTEEA